uniref:Lipocalin/cytosolic fatty-acid binding domain-containing protein n=1 Tax=Leptobrachium leishanense TaxID=445787 RepID=A0A8C5QYB2_9ANUR
MKGLTLALGLLVALCTLCAQAKPVIKPDIKPNKVAGTWFGLAVASDSILARIRYWAVYTSDLDFTDNGNLVVKTTFPKIGRCEKESKIYTKTDTPGRYNSEASGSELEFMTAYDQKIVVMVKSNRGPISGFILSLLGRTMNLPPEDYEIFKQLALDVGANVDDVFPLPQLGLCGAPD